MNDQPESMQELDLGSIKYIYNTHTHIYINDTFIYQIYIFSSNIQLVGLIVDYLQNTL